MAASKGQPSTVGFRYAGSMELIFEIRDAEQGGFYAHALGHSIFTQGETWDELRGNLLEAVSLHFDDATTRPRLIQMHFVKDELVLFEAA
jgi:predicted RNase H-like HicB family nuclease